MPTNKLPLPADADPPDGGRNRRWLQALAGCSGERRLAWRNAVVAANLPLVRRIAARLGPTCTLPFEERVQVGCLGLIRAVEAFDLGRAVHLSTFAVPYIRGAIRHEVRDRQSLVRAPRALWDLRQRLSRLQEERRLRGQPPLGERALAETLGCGPGMVREASRLARTTAIRSLDAPASGRRAGEEAPSLLDALPDPASLRAGEEPAGDPADQRRREVRRSHQWRWLAARLAALPPIERELLLDHLVVGASWVEMGARLGMPARQAQRRCTAVLHRLQEAARARAA
ncbi:MAG: sigma-70 family RNA polymerase sigma factor [Synechococcaceae cyanobacterium]|nr:sigma-70 family RNA polymerase sigma factor [Synechococcaceae cyanobacterium]